jgi:hypothetical protein
MTPERVFRWVRSLGGDPGRVLVVGCEPLSLEEEIGLSAPVERAVGEAVSLVLDLVAREREPLRTARPGRRASSMHLSWLLWGALALFLIYVLYVTVPSAIRYWKLKNM